MKAGWKRVKLGEAISAIGDRRGRTPPKLTIGKYRVLSAKNIKTGKIVAEDSIGYFDDELYAKYVRMEIERGDIIITSEAPFGQVYYWNSDEKVALSQRLFSEPIAKPGRAVAPRPPRSARVADPNRGGTRRSRTRRPTVLIASDRRIR